MNAGELTVRVRAELSEFDGQMREVERRAGEAGQKAGEQMTEKVGAYAKFGDAITKRFTGPMAFIGIAENVSEAINIANEKGIGAGLEALVNSTPIIGTAYRLGSAIGNAIGDALSDADEMEEAMAERLAAFEARIPSLMAKEKEQQRGLTQLADQTVQAAALERKLGIENARAIGDQREVAYLEALDRVATMERERDIALGNAVTDEEKERIRTNHELRLDLEQVALDSRFAEIQRREDEQAQREKEAADRIAAQEAKEQQRLAEQAEKDAERLAEKEAQLAEKNRKEEIKFLEDQLDAVADEMTDIEERRKEAQGGAIEGFETALGTFKFDAYPDSEKRKNDVEMVNALKELVKRGLGLSEQRAALGFN